MNVESLTCSRDDSSILIILRNELTIIDEKFQQAHWTKQFAELINLFSLVGRIKNKNKSNLADLVDFINSEHSHGGLNGCGMCQLSGQKYNKHPCPTMDRHYTGHCRVLWTMY